VVQRSIEIAAPPAAVFAIVSDLRRFHEFSPWAELDPNISYSFEGPPSGVGQKMTWRSANPAVGTGSQTITELVENRRVALALDFGEMGEASASFEISPVGANTAVTWGFKSALANPVERWTGLLFDRWIGADYEKGLAKLKRVAESP
jgi:uncharacterized protein YndB with AHSA1/START domain